MHAAQASTQENVFEPAKRLIDGPEARWPRPLMIAFRFTFSCLLLFIFPFPFGSFLLSATRYEVVWHTIVPWIAVHILHLSAPAVTIANSDTRYGLLRALCCVFISAVATVIWSTLDRKRRNYSTLHNWLRLYARVMLAGTLFIYGADKVIPAQMPAPGPGTLLQPLGDLSPQGLLWSFMGASYPYQIFAGAVELLAGILLLVPGMETLGALSAVAAMTNVFMLNLSYDVSVKLFSGLLLLLSVFLLLPDLRRLVNFFLLHRTAELSSRPPLFRRRALNYAAWGVQWALGAFYSDRDADGHLETGGCLQCLGGDQPFIWHLAGGGIHIRRANAAASCDRQDALAASDLSAARKNYGPADERRFRELWANHRLEEDDPVLEKLPR